MRSMEEIAAEAMQLNPEDREALASRLFDSLKLPPPIRQESLKQRPQIRKDKNGASIVIGKVRLAIMP
jgi:hypothetical protein